LIKVRILADFLIPLECYRLVHALFQQKNEKNDIKNNIHFFVSKVCIKILSIQRILTIKINL